MDYNNWITSLREIHQEQETPLSLRNGQWEIVDRIALWETLGSRIFDTHLDQLKESAIKILTELDPKFELPAEERYAASIHGKVLKHSSAIRKGMAETLALLRCHGEVLINCSQSKPENTASFAIRAIFEHADWQLWGSLNYLLPTLAEAAPGEFLNSVERALQQTPCPFDDLFAQEGKGFSGANYITGLLWALESLSWSEERLIRVAVVLSELASHDPGGSWENRPANSLVTILLPWLPQTLASADKRVSAVKAIRKEYPDIAWSVVLRLLPNQHQTSTGAHKPQWCDVLPVNWEPEVRNKDYWEQIKAYAEIAVEMAREDLYRLTELVGNLDNLPEPSFDALLEHLNSNKITKLLEAERLPIWTKLTDFASKHRRYSDAKWALKEDVIARIEDAAKALEPSSPEGLYRRLFSSREHDLYEKKGDWEEQRKKLEKKRQNAIKEIIEGCNLKGVIEFVDTVEAPNHVGHALGNVVSDEFDIDLMPEYLGVESSKLKLFISSYVWGRFHSQGWQWVDRLDRKHWTLAQTSHFLMYLPFGMEVWSRASDWLDDSENLYWEEVNVNPYQCEDEILYAIDKLLDVSRPKEVIDCLNYQLYKKIPVDSKRAVKALLDAVHLKDAINNIDTYHITELIKALQENPDTDKDDLYNVEWAYLQLLDKYSDASPKFLEERLATQPEFFCEVIRLIYRSKNEEKKGEESDEKKKNIAANAWHLLDEWKRPPGLNVDGSYSVNNFKEWLKIVKQQCNKTGHLEVALIKVGEVLFYCPPDSNGLWIVEEVANALNEKDAEEMRNGYRTEVYNSRGVHWVDPTGKPELELSSEWRKKSESVEDSGYVRFATVLRELADSYKREAERIEGDAVNKQ